MNKPTALPVRAKPDSAKHPAPSPLNGKKPPKTSDVVLDAQGDEVHLSFGGLRRYRIRGLEKNHSSQQLKVNVLAVRDGCAGDSPLVHLDTLDLDKANRVPSFHQSHGQRTVRRRRSHQTRHWHDVLEAGTTATRTD